MRSNSLRREVDEAGRRNLVGLSREELTAAMAEIGQPAFRARQLWHWIYHRGATDFAAMTNLAKEFRAALAEHFIVGRPAVSGRPPVDRRHAQVAAQVRRRPGSRNGPHPGRGPRHAVRLLAGRLHADLQVLPHRHAAPGAQPVRAGDRRPGHAWRATSSANGRAPKDGPHAVQHRHDGHGRAALQLRQRRQGAEDRDGPRGHRHLASADHPVDRGRGADDRALRRGARRQSGDLAARGDRRVARPHRADQQEIPDRRTAGRLPQLSRPQQRAAHHLRIRDAEGRQRQPGRRARAGPAAQGHPGQGQPDPVQSLAGRAVRALDAGARSRRSATSCSTPAMPARCAPRAARTSWRPAAS